MYSALYCAGPCVSVRPLMLSDCLTQTCRQMLQPDVPCCRHTTRFVMLYLTFLPLALWKHLHWGTLVATPMIAFLLAGIESIGMNMENPMKRLPMGTYCKILHSNILVAASNWAFGEPVRLLSLLQHTAALFLTSLNELLMLCVFSRYY
jgi:hypothetical protein